MDKADKIVILLLDLAQLLITPFFAIGIVLIEIDIFHYIQSLNIIQENFFTMMGWIGLTLYFPFRIYRYFDYMISNFKRRYKHEANKKEEKSD